MAGRQGGGREIMRDIECNSERTTMKNKTKHHRFEGCQVAPGEDQRLLSCCQPA
jgi:hypothetical protein